MNSFSANAFIGIYFVFFVIFLLQFFAYRKKEYLFYSFYLITLVVYYLLFTTTRFINENELPETLASMLKQNISSVAIIMYTFFSVAFLEIKKYSPGLYRGYLFFIGINFFGIFLYTMMYFLQIPSQQFYYYANLLFGPFTFYLIIRALQLKIPYTRYILAGSLIATAGGIWSIILSIEKYSYSYFPGQLAILIDILLFFYVTQKKVVDMAAENIQLKFKTLTDLQEERQRISLELHDEVGGGLSTIYLLSELSKNKNATEKHLDTISKNSKDLVLKMNEIVWALNIKNDSLQGLIGYLRQYFVHVLDELRIGVKANITENIPPLNVDGKNRREIFLLLKEIINNIIKHSNAQNVVLDIQIEQQTLTILVKDDGVGFTTENIKVNNFGLQGMHQRIQKLGGKIHIDGSSGTLIKIHIPLDRISYKSVIA